MKTKEQLNQVESKIADLLLENSGENCCYVVIMDADDGLQFITNASDKEEMNETLKRTMKAPWDVDLELPRFKITPAIVMFLPETNYILTPEMAFNLLNGWTDRGLEVAEDDLDNDIGSPLWRLARVINPMGVEEELCEILLILYPDKYQAN